MRRSRRSPANFGKGDTTLRYEASMDKLTEASDQLEQTIAKASEVQKAALKKMTQLAEM